MMNGSDSLFAGGAGEGWRDGSPDELRSLVGRRDRVSEEFLQNSSLSDKASGTYRSALVERDRPAKCRVREENAVGGVSEDGPDDVSDRALRDCSWRRYGEDWALLSGTDGRALGLGKRVLVDVCNEDVRGDQ